MDKLPKESETAKREETRLVHGNIVLDGKRPDGDLEGWERLAVLRRLTGIF